MLIIAVVVMTVILLLGLALTRVLASSSNAVVYEVFGLRAYNTAGAGIQHTLEVVFNNANPVIACTNNSTIDSSVSFPNFSSVAGFENCRFNTTCTSVNFPVTGGTEDYFRLTSTAQCTSGGITVSRTIAVDARI